MNFSIRRTFTPTVIFLATAGLAQAHPGHDDHDFTWDLSHLVANPGATILCFGLVGAAAWGLWKLKRSAVPGAKSQRAAAESRPDLSRR